MQINREGRYADMQQAEAIIRENLKEEFASRDAVVKRADELADIVYLALAALQDHQPALSAMLMNKAKKIFGEK